MKSLALFFILLISPHLYAKTDSINFVITGAIVPSNSIYIYKKIARYLTINTKSKILPISDISYSGANIALKNGAAKLGAICGYPYVVNRESDSLRLLAIPVISTTKSNLASYGIPNGPEYEKTPGKYYSYIVVKNESPFNSFVQLKGHSFSIADTSSNSSYNVIRSKLIDLGTKSWSHFFGETTVSGSHEDSINLVARGLVTAASVDSLVFDILKKSRDPNAMKLKVIDVLGPTGIPPLVASKYLSDDLFKKIQAVLLDMHETAEGRKILTEAMIERFDTPDDHNYDDIRSMIEKSIKNNFVDLSLHH